MLVRVHRVQTGEHHGFNFFEAGQSFESGIGVIGNGVADLGIGHVLYVRDEKPDLASFQLVDFHRLGREHAQGLGVERCPIRPQADSLAFAQRALEDASKYHHTAVGVEPGVEDQRLQPGVWIALGRRYALHDSFQYVGHPLASLRADEHGIGSVESDGAFDHFFRSRNVGALQIDLIDDRNYFESVVDRQVGVGERLCFHSLGSVDDEQGAFARSQRSRDFIRKVHVPGSIDQVELVSLAILRGVHHTDGMGLNGNAAFALQVHGIEHLRLHLARSERPGQLQQAVRQRGFAVVDMRDDGKIAEESGVHRLRD